MLKNVEINQKSSSRESSVVGFSHSSDAPCLEGSAETVSGIAEPVASLSPQFETASSQATLPIADIQRDSDILVYDAKSRTSEAIQGAHDNSDAAPAEQRQSIGRDHSQLMITVKKDEKASKTDLLKSGIDASNHPHTSGIPQSTSAAYSSCFL